MYDLDLTGKSVDNLVKSERAIIANCQNQYWCFIPTYAPFFADSLKLKQITNGQVNDLIEGIHYHLSHYYAEGEVATKRRMYGSICLKEPLTGVLEFREYQTMGGSTTVSKVAITKHLGSLELPDPRNIDWSVVQQLSPVTLILDKPESYAEAIGTDEIIASIEDINQVLLKTSTKDTVYAELKQSILATQQRMVTEGYYTHTTTPAAHGLSPAIIGAYKRGDTVEDTLQAFGYSLNELGSYCISKGISPEVLDKYLAPGDTFTGIMHISEQNPLVLPNANISKSVAGLTIAVKGSIALVADTTLSQPGKTASIHSGNHILSVYSRGPDVTERTANLDGYDLVTKNVLYKYTNWLESKNAVLQVNLKSTATATLSGAGKSSSPLKGTAIYPWATKDVYGAMYIASTEEQLSTNRAMAASLLYTIEKRLSKYVLGSYTINGKPLTSDIVLTLADFGLGNANNTALANKPLSIAWTSAVDNKASATHKHYVNTLIPTATNTTAGVVSITNTDDLSILDKAASVALASSYSTKLAELATSSIKFIVGTTMQLGSVNASAPRISKQGVFIAIEVA